MDAAVPNGVVQAQDLTRSSNIVAKEADGIVTRLTGNPTDYATISIDGEVHAGFAVADATKVEKATMTPDGTAVFPMKNSDNAYAFQILDSGSLSASAVTTSPESKKEFTYTFSEGVVPVVQKTGAVALYHDDKLIGIVEHSEARDAVGHTVPSSYSVVEGDLVQSAFPTANTAYPLVTTARIGVFQTRGDFVHVSKGQASGHGWWLKGTTKAVKARVKVQLQYKPNRFSLWHNRGATGVRTIKAGSGKRANARLTCRSSGRKQWRSWVDVDLIGYLDTPNKLYTPARTLKCTL